MSNTILMLATFGLEIVEVGGTLALHAQSGDTIHAAVLLSRPESRPQVTEAAKILGVRSTRFLEINYGEVIPDVPSKLKLVRLFRELRPTILITQDPEHSYHDLDPDRRLAMLLYLESIALAGRDWRIEECGGFEPHSINEIYYMSPEQPNCVVEIGATFLLKQKALDCLNFQLTFSAQMMRERIGDEVLRTILPNYDDLRDDNLELGRALHHAMDMSLAMNHGVLSHSGAALGEAFRHQGPFKLTKLL